MRIESISSITPTGRVDPIGQSVTTKPFRNPYLTLPYAFNSKKLAREFGQFYELSQAEPEEEKNTEIRNFRYITTSLNEVTEDKMDKLDSLIEDYNNYFIPKLSPDETRRFRVTSSNVDYLIDQFNKKLSDIRHLLYTDSKSKYINTMA